MSADFFVDAVSALTPLLVAFLGIGGTLIATRYSGRDSSDRAQHERRAISIAKLIQAWSVLLTAPSGARPGDMSAQVAASLAGTELLLNTPHPNSEPIEDLVNYTLVSLIEERANGFAYLGAAQNALLGWHQGKFTPVQAFDEYRSILAARGIHVAPK